MHLIFQSPPAQIPSEPPAPKSDPTPPSKPEPIPPTQQQEEKIDHSKKVCYQISGYFKLSISWASALASIDNQIHWSLILGELGGIGIMPFQFGTRLILDFICSQSLQWFPISHPSGRATILLDWLKTETEQYNINIYYICLTAS